MRTATAFTCLVTLVTVAGCGGPSADETFARVGAKIGQAGEPAAAQPAPNQAAEPEPAVERKIIYTATVELDVKDIDATAASVAAIAKDYGGYVARSDISGQLGRSRRATWTIKVKADKFPEAVGKFLELGEVTRKATDSQDVTEEFVDVEARLKNYRAEEAKLNELLEKAVGKIEDLLKVREQIKVVRGEIERAEGRLKYLTAMTDFSTITVTAREEVPYRPEATGESATFGEQAKARLSDSWAGLRRGAAGFALACVGILPYLPLYLVGGLLAVWLLRRGWRQGKAVVKG